MSYRLHYAPDNASLIIRMALDHAGVPFETALVDRAARAQDGAAYRALNPHGLIPVLETDAGALFETGAILLWLLDRHRGLGPGPTEAHRGNFLKWLFFVSNTLHPALRMMFYPEKYIAADHAAPLRDGLTGSLRQSLGALEDLAREGPPWFRPDDPGALHFYVVACLRWCALYPVGADRSWFALAQSPRLRDICAAVETLPCTAKAIAAEGLGQTPFTRPDYANPPEGTAT